MTYELCKKLKDAGFPQGLKDGFKGESNFYIDSSGKINLIITGEIGEKPSEVLIRVPTLSELIKECGGAICLTTGKNCVVFWYEDPLGWGIEVEKSRFMETGSTPEIAVANLWLELNKKP